MTSKCRRSLALLAGPPAVLFSSAMSNDHKSYNLITCATVQCSTTYVCRLHQHHHRATIPPCALSCHHSFLTCLIGFRLRRCTACARPSRSLFLFPSFQNEQ
ncbi:hypothetical protein FA13DRAFT_1459892 [Coprinellus micaceus]|uniref:Uncharacterized protein n=1 Tax=Coprinellus micaceus TaxID=71717 RepID=A0A4Y7SMM7_COPMI|nr:hypothetical protein FA13DRAFT_1459892 [Coprinellus micaceus]